MLWGVCPAWQLAIISPHELRVDQHFRLFSANAHTCPYSVPFLVAWSSLVSVSMLGLFCSDCGCGGGCGCRVVAWKKVGSTAVLQQVSCNLDLGRD